MKSAQCAPGLTNCEANMADVPGRRDSLESLIRDHSYSTETVRRAAEARSACTTDRRP